TVWLTQKRMAELFQKNVRTINEHIKNIFDEGELLPESVIRNFRITAEDGKRYNTQHYNLDVIISVGYRVKSHRGTQFRIWATERLREYIIKGFSMDDDRLKRAGGGNYFDELLARIRDIRSAEKVFWRKVLDIYATSIDYDPRTDVSQGFFATIQNKMHWAAHGQTAAEVVYRRVDAEKENMGITNWVGSRPSKSEAVIAKNYLTPEELDTLNRIVNAYLEFAELQALSRKPMYMQDWIAKLDDFLKLSERELLTHVGTISHEDAVKRAQVEYEKHRALQINRPSPVEKHFEQAIKKLPKPGEV
ncbi:MAG: virulence RhuM family protein, partial [Deltaproteobacteria bacterium]|nr:virulence RhuM family protein [Deltaproteobacteria bacterium]